MAHVITDTCVKDNLCFDACPNGCIGPNPDDPKYAEVNQLYINPDECLDCGACIAACPTNSIFPADELPGDKKDFAAKNAEFFAS
jgi:NAD-dependent dihydropyrimidine dehydrogenase PreA subunit